VCKKHNQTRSKIEQQKHGFDITEAAQPTKPMPDPTAENLHNRKEP